MNKRLKQKYQGIILGYGIIPVPTGILRAEVINSLKMKSTRVCPECQHEDFSKNARYCDRCGSELKNEE